MEAGNNLTMEFRLWGSRIGKMGLDGGLPRTLGELNGGKMGILGSVKQEMAISVESVPSSTTPTYEHVIYMHFEILNNINLN